MKKFFVGCVCFLVGFILTSCGPKVAHVEVDDSTIPEEIHVGTVDVTKFQVKVTYSDDTTKNISLTRSMFSDEEYQKFNQEGHQRIKFTCEGKLLELSIQVVAEYFEVEFLDFDGTVLKTETVKKGLPSTPPPTPDRIGYTFTGWDQELGPVVSDMKIKANYTTKMLTVRFLDADGTVLSTQQVAYGLVAVYPNNPTHEGYAFKGWSVPASPIQEDVDIVAEYEAITFTVRFIDDSGKVLKVEEVKYGMSATPPQLETKIGTVFKRWDKDFTNVTENIDVIAIFEPIQW